MTSSSLVDPRLCQLSSCSSLSPVNNIYSPFYGNIPFTPAYSQLHVNSKTHQSYSMVFNCEESFHTRSSCLTLLVHTHIVPIHDRRAVPRPRYLLQGHHHFTFTPLEVLQFHFHHCYRRPLG